VYPQRDTVHNNIIDSLEGERKQQPPYNMKVVKIAIKMAISSNNIFFIIY
jgi:hypothetical protein